MMDESARRLPRHAGNPDSDLRWCAGWYLDGFRYYPDDDLLWRTDCKPDLYAGNSFPDYCSCIYRNRYLLGSVATMGVALMGIASTWV